MGGIAVKYANFVIITSDNPRTEKPMAIIQDILSGINGTKTPYAVEEDRRRAINLAIDCAAKGDCILIAGKGHETFQELGDTIIPFDDKRVAEELLNLKGLV